MLTLQLYTKVPEEVKCLLNKLKETEYPKDVIKNILNGTF